MNKNRTRAGIIGLFILALLALLVVLLSNTDSGPRLNTPRLDQTHDQRQGGADSLEASGNGDDIASGNPDDILTTPPEAAQDTSEGTEPLDDDDLPSAEQLHSPTSFEFRLDLVVPTYDIPGLETYRPAPLFDDHGVRIGVSSSNVLFAVSGGFSTVQTRLSLADYVRKSNSLVFRNAVSFIGPPGLKPTGEHTFYLTAFLLPVSRDGRVIHGLSVVAAAYHKVSAEQVIEDRGRIVLRVHRNDSQLELQLSQSAAGGHCIIGTFWRGYSPTAMEDLGDRERRALWPMLAGAALHTEEGWRDAPHDVQQQTFASIAFQARPDDIGRVRILSSPAGMGIATGLIANGESYFLDPAARRQHEYAVSWIDSVHTYVPATAAWQLSFTTDPPVEVPRFQLSASPPLTPDEFSLVRIHCSSQRGSQSVAIVYFDEARPQGYWRFTEHVGTLEEYAGQELAFTLVAPGFDIVRFTARLAPDNELPVSLTRTVEGYSYQWRVVDSDGLTLPLHFSLSLQEAGWYSRAPSPLRGTRIVGEGEHFELKDLPLPIIDPRLIGLDEQVLGQVITSLLAQHSGMSLPATRMPIQGVFLEGRREAAWNEVAKSDSSMRVFEGTLNVQVTLPVPKPDVDPSKLRFVVNGDHVVLAWECWQYADMFRGSLREYLNLLGLLDDYSIALQEFK